MAVSFDVTTACCLNIKWNNFGRRSHEKWFITDGHHVRTPTIKQRLTFNYVFRILKGYCICCYDCMLPQHQMKEFFHLMLPWFASQRQMNSFDVALACNSTLNERILSFYGVISFAVVTHPVSYCHASTETVTSNRTCDILLCKTASASNFS